MKRSSTALRLDTCPACNTDRSICFDLSSDSSLIICTRWCARHKHKKSLVSAPMGLLYESELSEENEGTAVVYIGISVGLTLLAGLMSGLTLGLMSMDHVDLQASPSMSTANEPRTAASRLQPAVQCSASVLPCPDLRCTYCRFWSAAGPRQRKNTQPELRRCVLCFTIDVQFRHMQGSQCAVGVSAIRFHDF